MDMLDLMKQRHSVRQYTDRVIEPEKRSALNDFIQKINQSAGLHIQIFYEEPKCFELFAIFHPISHRNCDIYFANPILNLMQLFFIR